MSYNPYNKQDKSRLKKSKFKESKTFEEQEDKMLDLELEADRQGITVAELISNMKLEEDEDEEDQIISGKNT